MQHSSFTPNQGVELSQHTLATIKTKEPNQTRELVRGNPQGVKKWSYHEDTCSQ